MANLYVSPLGNDANNGLSPSTPKRTPQAVHDAAADGDTVKLGAGVYTPTAGQLLLSTKNLTWETDGQYVVFDGLGLVGSAIVYQGSPTFVGIYFRNMLTYQVLYTGSNTTGTFRQCVFDCTGFPDAICLYQNKGSFNVERCEFIGGRYALSIVSRDLGSVPQMIENNTFYKHSAAAIYYYFQGTPQGSVVLNMRNNAFVVDGGAAAAIRVESSAGFGDFTSNWNNFDCRNGGNVGLIGSGTYYQTLASWQAVAAGKDQQSIAVPSGFLFEDDRLFVPDIAIPSQLIGAGQPTGSGGGKTIGAYNGGSGFTRNSPEWLAGVHQDTEFEPGTNRIILEPGKTVGTFTTATKTFPGPLILSLQRMLAAFAEADVTSLGSVQCVNRTTGASTLKREIELKLDNGPFKPISYGLAAQFPDPTVAQSFRLRVTLRMNGAF